MAQESSGRVIMFDGPDGVGKTTQIALLKDALLKRNHQVYVTRSHGGTPIGEALRKVSLSDVPRPASTDLYISLAIHAALAEDLEAKRQAGIISLVDRSPLSIWAYQVYGSGLAQEVAEPLVRDDIAHLKPELMIVYQASLTILSAHRPDLTSAKADFFESKPAEYFERVIEGYSDAAQRFGAKTLDASGTIQAVHEATLATVEQLLY